MVALRMATVSFLPGEFGMTDCAKSEPAKNAQANAVTRLLIFFLLRFRFFLFVRFLLQAIRFLLRHLLAQLEVVLPIEDDFAVDERRLDARVGGERMAGPDHEIGVFAGVDRADAGSESKT